MADNTDGPSSSKTAQPKRHTETTDMTKRGKIARQVVVVLTGGVMLQAVGCTTGILPVLLSLAESTVLSFLFV